MDVNTALSEFYTKHGFGNDIGKRPPLTVKVYTGCMLVPLPNLEVRRIYLKYHDLHHILTGYSVGRVGEGKMSAWELGTGTFYTHPMLGLMNLIALSTGIFLNPKGMLSAFLVGKRSYNIYSKQSRLRIDRNEVDVLMLRNQTLNCRDNISSVFLAKCEFYIYCIIAIIIHIMLVIPAITVRTFSDLVATGSIIKSIKPKKRTDLF
jgi:hypothetical protein